MLNFIFNTPTKVFFGKDQITVLGEEILKYGKNILLVYGKGSIKKSGIYEAVVNELKKNNISYTDFEGVDPNPRISSVRKGAEICKKNNIEFVLAVGGGSVIDCAKAISFAALYDSDPWDLWTGKTEVKQTLPVGAVLTISATASEMNKNSVISNEETEEKLGKGDPLFIPKFAILDPCFTFSVPAYQTAAGVADTMAHIFEYYFSPVETAFLQDGMEEAVLKTCIKYAPIAIKEPDNYIARANLMWASSMALNGVTSAGKTFEGTLHSIEHALSGIYDITHGAGLAILSVHWFNHVLSEKTVDAFVRFSENVWGISDDDKFECAKKGIENTTKFYKSIGMPVYLKDCGIKSPDYEKIADKSLIKNKTIGKFKTLDRNDIISILKTAE